MRIKKDPCAHISALIRSFHAHFFVLPKSHFHHHDVSTRTHVPSTFTTTIYFNKDPNTKLIIRGMEIKGQTDDGVGRLWCVSIYTLDPSIHLPINQYIPKAKHPPTSWSGHPE